MAWLGKLLFRVAWAFAWTFAARRKAVLLHVWYECDPLPVAFQRFFFYLRRPKLYLYVRRLIDAERKGIALVAA